MKLILRIVACITGLLLLLILLCVLVPSVPGQVILSRLQGRLPEGVTLSGLSVSPLGPVHLAQLGVEHQGTRIHIADMSTRLSLATLLGPRRSGQLQVGRIVLDTVQKIHLDGQAALEFRQDQPEQFAIGFRGDSWKLRLPVEEREPVTVNGSLAGNIWKQDHFSGDCLLKLLDGELLTEFNNPGPATDIRIQTRKPLVPAMLHRVNPLIPYRLDALEAWLTAEVKLRAGQVDGIIRFHTGVGQMITLESTQPVSLHPTGFGEVPTQLGLSPDLSSQFERISGSVVLEKGGADIHLAIDSPHHHLTLDGHLQDHWFTGNLVLSLPPETLAHNTLGLSFSNLGPEDHFRIYGQFTGPLDDISASWDLDRFKLLESAADGLKQRLFKLW